MPTPMTAALATAALATAAAAEPAVTGTLVVINKAEASASLLNLADGEEFARLPTGPGPHEVAVSPDGRTAVVADYGVRGAPGNTLTVIDLPGRKVVRTIDLGDHHRPHGILYLPDGRRVVVTAEQEQHLLTVDVASGRIDAAIKTGQDVSHMVALPAEGRRAYVANIGSGTVSVIDLPAGNVIATVPTGEGAEGIDVAPDGAEVWASNRSADTVSVIDTSSLEVIETLPCESFPIRVKFTPDGRHVLVSNARSGDVAVFNAATRELRHRIPMQEEAVEDTGDRVFRDAFGRGPVPVGILVEPRGRRAYVANTNADRITVIDLADWTVAGRLTAGREPDGMAYSPLVPQQDEKSETP